MSQLTSPKIDGWVIVKAGLDDPIIVEVEDLTFYELARLVAPLAPLSAVDVIPMRKGEENGEAFRDIRRWSGGIARKPIRGGQARRAR